MTLTLHYAPDNASLIIRLALEELGLPYQHVLVDRAAREQDSAAYRQINPHGLIPAFQTPDGALLETGAILLWLADRYPETLAPAPQDSARGDFLKWLFFLSNTLHPALRMTFYPDKYAPGHASDLRAHMQGEIIGHLNRINGAMIGPWFLGDAPSALDLYLAPMLRWMALYPVGYTDWFDLSRWPALLAMCTGLEARESTRAAQSAEGLGPRPFSAPQLARPPEGSAT
ncbi:glutathione S-transferase family protein [Roseovarius aestuarii]|nr:glutathione S-transferase family protein [Roseovarius aestuarii]